MAWTRKKTQQLEEGRCLAKQDSKFCCDVCKAACVDRRQERAGERKHCRIQEKDRNIYRQQQEKEDNDGDACMRRLWMFVISFSWGNQLKAGAHQPKLDSFSKRFGIWNHTLPASAISEARFAFCAPRRDVLCAFACVFVWVVEKIRILLSFLLFTFILWQCFENGDASLPPFLFLKFLCSEYTINSWIQYCHRYSREHGHGRCIYA